MSGVVGLEQHLLVTYVHIRRDACVSSEFLLHASVLAEDMEVLGLVGMRLPELDLLLCPHHLCVVMPAWTVAPARCRPPFPLGHQQHWLRVSSLVCQHAASCNAGDILLLLR